ncbi:MAG: flavin reductase family protein [Oscillospiraceae bacterium]|nr:flavin reductase family protein [Oscillospiraceae bacterium]
MKKQIDVWQYAPQILEAVGKGVLMTTAANGVVDSMVIGWGTLGIQWKKPLFTAFVRQSRYTKELLDQNPEFTINVPLGELDSKIMSVCGSKSGRDMDKVAHLGLDLVAGETVSVPAIRQVPLTLECKVIYRQDQVLEDINEENRNRYYREGTRDEGDFHTAFYGQITAAYILED